MRVRRLWLWLIAVSLGLLGCQRAEPPPSGSLITPSTAPGPGPPAASARASARVVRTASLELSVADVSTARVQVAAAVTLRGGMVKSAELSRSAGAADEPAHLSVRVPEERFDETLKALAALAVRVSDERTSAEDVTEAHVDLAARVTAKRAIEARYLSLLERAQNVKEILEVERELGALRTEIEQLEAQKALLESRSAFATIDVTLVRERGRVTASLGALGSSLIQAGIDGINGAATLVTVAFRVLGHALPVLLLLGLPGYAVCRAIRAARRRARAAAQA